MPKKPIAEAIIADDEMRKIVLGLRFGGAVPDKAAPTYFSITLMAKAIRKPKSWIQ